MSEEFKVHVVKYPDRANLVMRYRRPVQRAAQCIVPGSWSLAAITAHEKARPTTSQGKSTGASKETLGNYG